MTFLKAIWETLYTFNCDCKMSSFFLSHGKRLLFSDVTIEIAGLGKTCSLFVTFTACVLYLQYNGEYFFFLVIVSLKIKTPTLTSLRISHVFYDKYI